VSLKLKPSVVVSPRLCSVPGYYITLCINTVMWTTQSSPWFYYHGSLCQLLRLCSLRDLVFKTLWLLPTENSHEYKGCPHFIPWQSWKEEISFLKYSSQTQSNKDPQIYFFRPFTISSILKYYHFCCSHKILLPLGVKVSSPSSVNTLN
jgi:hypothetical protein